MERVSFKLEFLFRASPTIVYRFLTAPECLIRWFCDQADILIDKKTKEVQYVYSWDGEEEIADVIDDFEDEYVKLQWEEAESDDEFLEFKLEKSPVTNETILYITDWCDADEVEDQQQLWIKQMDAMRKAMGG